MARKSYKLTDKDFAKMQKVHAKANKYTDNSLHFYLSFNLRVCLLAFVIVMLGVIAFNCYKASFSDAKTTIAKYKTTGSVGNNVIRFENAVLDTGNLVVGDTYISDLVDDIGLDFNYDIDFNKDVEYTYSYNVTGKMSLFNNDRDVIAYRDFDILKVINNTVTGNKMILKQNINLDYDYYNNLAKDLDVKGELQGNMHLVMNIEVKINDLDFEDVNTINKVIEVDIPLLSDDVKVTADNFDDVEAFAENFDSKLEKPSLLFIAILIIIFDTLLLMNSITYIAKMIPKKSKYCILRDGLLQDYDKIIVNSRKLGRFGEYHIIDCYSFQELMDAQKLLEKPIVYYEIVKDQKCIFYLIDGNDCYQFILKECDIDY